ncbi:M28 family peptidase [Flammeovirga sp. EKP202]|uniref:M28 family peptidase n=1 Tax=Flammeovirga sp. EKP202 TaxID=2770592 RepID=UPI00165F6C48|nr:M28 family peptidase [Flammeovirga sp. EKP202]MBD0401303.1 M28 family peptidase [Flammeovirga sp. EKP202]
MKQTLLSTLLSILISSAFAQNITLESESEKVNKYKSTITEEEMKSHLTILASDEFEGRETGERGQKMAADYIAQFFMDQGLKGPVPNVPNPYFQQFDLYKQKYTNFSIQKGDVTLQLIEDIFPYGNFSFKQDLDVVFIGYGEDNSMISDYDNVDVKGKGVVFFEKTPRIYGKSKKEISGLRIKAKIAAEKGASFAIVIAESDEKYTTQAKRYGSYISKGRLMFNKPEEKSDNGFGLVLLKPSSFYRLIGVSESKFDKRVAKVVSKGKSAASGEVFNLNINAQFETRKMPTENVLGFMEGTDLKDEVLVVTSHYDHVGIINGEIHNGADDDGSGTTGLLEIVNAFTQAKKEGNAPRRSILFMTVTGEEKGLLGSEYYSSHPIFPIDNTIANLNIDMIGRGDAAHSENPDFVYVIGADMLSSELHELHEQVAKKYVPELDLDYTYNAKDDPNRYYYRSDHYNFAKHGIPVIFYFNGTHEDYHQPTDTVDKITFGPMAKRAKLVFATAWELANRDKAPVVDQKTEQQK